MEIILGSPPPDKDLQNGWSGYGACGLVEDQNQCGEGFMFETYIGNGAGSFNHSIDGYGFGGEVNDPLVFMR